MEHITASLAPGNYIGAKSITFGFSNQVTGVALTQGAFPPSLSKYIAYDTLTPPTPFIAVTEDGNGRVLYDGGFPKLYNGRMPGWVNGGQYNPPQSFSDLQLGLKYFHNAIRWISEGRVSRKVLILGDNDESTGTNYQVKNATQTTSFGATVPNVCRVAGYSSVIKDSSNYSGGKLDPTLAELQEYACVILISSRSSPTAFITSGGVQALVEYRKSGGGLLIVTDHGYNLQSIEDVNNDGVGFFKTANAVASQFGAYFTGSVDRQAVNVGFLRQTYGDHPVYAGLLNTESFSASGSESLLVVTQTPVVAPAQVGVKQTSSNGVTSFNLLATLQDGSTQSRTFTYNNKASFPKQNEMLVMSTGRAKINAAIAANTPLPNLSIKYKSGTTALTAATASIAGLQDFYDPVISSNVKGTDVTFSVLVDPWKTNFYPCTLALVSGNDLIAAVSIDLVSGVDVPFQLPLLIKDTALKAFTQTPAMYDIASFETVQKAISRVSSTQGIWQPPQTPGFVLIGRGLDLPCATKPLVVFYSVSLNADQLVAAKASNQSNLIIDEPGQVVWVKNADWEVSPITIDSIFGPGQFCLSQHNNVLYYRAPSGVLLNLTN